jgi:alginate O-acetyltransferase complex protein AlgI
MLFNSYLFWIFFAVVISLYHRLNFYWQNRMLLVASYIFYGTWDWRFVFLLAGTTLMDYFVALGMTGATSQRKKKGLLLISISANLLLLSFFKYYGFFSQELLIALQHIGIHASLPMLRVVLPVGISFYTFQELSYTIDVYRGRTKAVRNLLDFALYVSFFPQLVAGPIERSDHLIPQILNPRRLQPGDFAAGFYLVLIGLFRKVVIADNMAAIADAVFSRPTDHLTGTECLMGLYAFALQIYCDFSGYSSIAQGIARWMGVRLMDNFRMPYLATSPSDFWHRWHISLSTWLRDYLYIPLGGNRSGNFKTYRNLMLTMTIGGLWHGANWTFICWGLYHGLLLCLWRPFEMKAARARKLAAKSSPSPGTPGEGRGEGDFENNAALDSPNRPHPTVPELHEDRERGPDFPGLAIHAVKIIVMFHLVCFGWLLFRAQNLSQVGSMLHCIFRDFRWTYASGYCIRMIIILAGPLLLYEWWLQRRGDLLALVKVHWLFRGLAYSFLIWSLQVFPAEAAHEFIYFQF